MTTTPVAARLLRHIYIYIFFLCMHNLNRVCIKRDAAVGKTDTNGKLRSYTSNPRLARV